MCITFSVLHLGGGISASTTEDVKVEVEVEGRNAVEDAKPEPVFDVEIQIEPELEDEDS